MSSSNRTRTVDDVIENQRYGEELNFLEMRNIDNNLNTENS